ncbi:MAG: tripartite tricarboxylate transporter TctB family protein [bacterium]
MREKNIAAGLVFLAIGLVYGYLTTGLPERTLPNTPGPSFLPWIITVCFLLLGGILLAQGLRTAPEGGDEEPPAGPDGGGRRARIGLLLIAGYLVALPYLGFLLATPLVFGGLMHTAGERRLLTIAAFSIAVPVLLYLLFQVLFQILLPTAAFLG